MDAKAIAEQADNTFVFWGYRRGRIVGHDGLFPKVDYSGAGYPGSYLIDSEKGDQWSKLLKAPDALVFVSGDDVIRIYRV